MSASAVVQVAGARHAFGDRRILDGVHLTLNRGELYCLLGVNGAGKTTLMRAVCGNLRLDQGHVKYLGRDVRTDPGARENIAFVPQNIAVYPYLTVAENLSVFGRLAGVPRSALTKSVAVAMESAGLADRATQITSTLSGGYQRRVNICASILHQPGALVLDEPTVGIDVEARDAVHVMLAAIKARGTAMLMTTHDLEQAQQIADRIGVLHEGRILAEGPPMELLQSMLGNRKEVIVQLGQEPDPRQARFLYDLGFDRMQGATEWAAQIAPEILEAGWLGARFDDARLAVKELRVRDPDLGSLFRLLVGRKTNS